jgi:hypothetical protein
MTEHTPISERDGISAVRRHIIEEHGGQNPAFLAGMKAADVRRFHIRLHGLEWGPQNPPMPDLVLEVIADPGEPPIDWDLEQVAHEHFESRRDRDG